MAFKSLFGQNASKLQVSRHSGLQKQVLSLYKSLLRAANTKEPEKREDLKTYIRSEFRQNMTLPKNEVMRIEWLVANGKNQLEILNSKQTDGITIMTISTEKRKKTPSRRPPPRIIDLSGQDPEKIDWSEIPDDAVILTSREEIFK
eukprot:GEZU01017737.1.p2 GENE.GEZU01017737.1~~GEZU01017737.1.p2  ORF type:complete len:146 (-),score=30.30 GEZU01017737.1:177-614(-)